MKKGNHSTGTNQTLAAVSTRYWILSGREVIREWEKSAQNVIDGSQNLLNKLWLLYLAFARSEVDFAGPFVTASDEGGVAGNGISAHSHV